MNTPKMYRNKRDGIWMMSYYDQKVRKRISLGTTDETVACIKFTDYTGLPAPRQQVIPAVTTPMPHLLEEPKITYIDAINEFMLSTYGIKDAWSAKRKPQCHKKSTQSLGLFQRFQKFSKVFYVNEITFNILQGYIASCLCTVGNGTLNKHIARFRTFLEFCVNMDYIRKNPAKLLKTQKVKTPVRYHFSKAEAKMILQNTNPSFKPFFELMLETGLRACDMWNLTKKNFPGGDFLYIKQEKTEGILNVPISKRAQEIVASLEECLFPWADIEWCKNNEEPNQRIQVRNELWMCFGAKHSGPNSNWGRLERGRAACKPNNIRLHTFRHTFAMWKLAEDTPLPVIKDLMGHKSIRMAELYASQMPKRSLIKYV